MGTIVDKALLGVVNLPADALFQTTNPSGGLIDQPDVESNVDELRQKFNELNKRHKKLMQDLADL